ncbi:MAG: hypothetical protein B6U75_04085 [Desulfurococcales archaeon ex4484_217_1]|nr:MAG: hypothetical protein B6U75_04085 [Desulfurococcales archaeon ex4484_217_1]
MKTSGKTKKKCSSSNASLEKEKTAAKTIPVEVEKEKLKKRILVKNIYAVKPPYAYVMIYVDEKGILRYSVLEPYLVPEEEAYYKEIKELILEEARIPITALRDYERASEALSETIDKIVKEFKIKLQKESIEDIVCDGYGIPVYVYHRDFEWMPTNVMFENPEELESFIRRLAFRAGQSITYARPIVEGPLPPEGFRAHLTLKEVSRRGSTFSIRKYSIEPYTIINLLKFNTLSTDVAAYLWLLIDNVMSFMVLGPMASGKTTLLNAIAMMIRPEAKIVTIEETPELRLPHENWVPMTVRPSFEPGVEDITLFELLKSALRQRPEENEPMNIPRVLIPLIKAFVHMGRVKVRGEIMRRVLRVVETVGIDTATKEVILNEVYTWDPVTDSWKFTGRSYAFEYIATNRGLPLSEIYKDFERRKVVLKWMEQKNMSRFSEVADVLRKYYQDPEETYRHAESELRRIE